MGSSEPYVVKAEYDDARLNLMFGRKGKPR